MKPAVASVARFWGPLALAISVAVGTSGCLIIPTPEYNTGRARANINKQTPKQFEPGQTTRTEVMTALGEPDAVAPDETKLAYRSEKVCGLWFVGGYGGAAGGAITRDRYLVVQFDGQGVLLKVERAATWAGSEYSGKLLTDASEGVDFCLPAAGAGEEPPVMTLRGSWFAGVDGYQGKGSANWIGQGGWLWVGGTRLQFHSDAEFANSGPVLTLPYDSLAEVRLEKYFLGRRLVVKSRTGDVHSFEIHGPKGAMQDKPALQRTADFLQARISAALAQKQ